MLDIRAGGAPKGTKVLALPVRMAGERDAGTAIGELDGASAVPASLVTELQTFLADVEHSGAAGTVEVLARPGREPNQVFLVGVGDGDPDGWRSAGAALARAAARRSAVTVLLPASSGAKVAAALAEGAWLASYRFRLAGSAGPTSSRPTAKASASDGPALRRINLATDEAADLSAALESTRSLAECVCLVRDLTNTPSAQKSPQWLAGRIASAAARRPGVKVTIWDEAELARAGFGGVLAVGSGARRPPRLLEMSWRPRGARTHVVLVGKGITFDSGGISIKPLEGMRLMRKDMGGAASVSAALLAAADRELPVRVSVLAPLAENLVSGSAFRPGDVVRHYGGMTTEVLNTDAEGRVVLADALAYAAKRLKPDYLLDMATLTGASHVALGKRTAALFTDNDAMAVGLTEAGADVGEPLWRLPLTGELISLLASDIADLNNSPMVVEAGAITAALYLREFTGELRDRWAHLDMSGPAWVDQPDGPLAKGATGWGVRLLLHWLTNLPPG